MEYKIFITGSGIADEALQLLKREGCIYETGDPKDTPGDLITKLKAFNPDALIVRQGKITREVQDAPENLKVICKHGVGTDNIDIEAASEKNIPVFYTPRANFESAAEHTLGLILSLMRRIPLHDRRIRNGVFDKKKYSGQELFKKPLGLIGFGQIGSRLAELISPFKMNVLVFDPYLKGGRLPENVTIVESVDEIYASADIISLHCPLTDETKNLINAQTINQMKPGVHIVNTARGGIINELDLCSALKSGRVAGAALDVFETEPPAADNPLFLLDNIIVTTHVAGVSDNSLINMGTDAVNNILAVLRGGKIDSGSLKNKEALQG